MDDKAVYQEWFSITNDPRYLRPKRWAELRWVIENFDVKTVLEFGAGVSTLLFTSMGCKVDSYETSLEHARMVNANCPGRPVTLWDNENLVVSKHYDLALVDGIQPRTKQMDIALFHADIVAVDDFRGRIESELIKKVMGCPRLDSQETLMAIFKIN